MLHIVHGFLVATFRSHVSLPLSCLTTARMECLGVGSFVAGCQSSCEAGEKVADAWITPLRCSCGWPFIHQGREGRTRKLQSQRHLWAMQPNTTNE